MHGDNMQTPCRKTPCRESNPMQPCNNSIQFLNVFSESKVEPKSNSSFVCTNLANKADFFFPVLKNRKTSIKPGELLVKTTSGECKDIWLLGLTLIISMIQNKSNCLRAIKLTQ
ncbi:hypothetical protein ILYODFUR_038556 [Ilyodon furcidens]|uniref:Uncharacterized protein n=1 Tax=Ilyodon furcidens TaxID=33524 RepID=A0ABV0T553_9TELE